MKKFKYLKEVAFLIGSILGYLLMIMGVVTNDNNLFYHGILFVILCEVFEINNKIEKK